MLSAPSPFAAAAVQAQWPLANHQVLIGGQLRPAAEIFAGFVHPRLPPIRVTLPLEDFDPWDFDLPMSSGRAATPALAGCPTSASASASAGSDGSVGSGAARPATPYRGPTPPAPAPRPRRGLFKPPSEQPPRRLLRGVPRVALRGLRQAAKRRRVHCVQPEVEGLGYA